MTDGAPLMLDRHRAAELLKRLDARLSARGIAAHLYVVGGMAIAMTVDDSRRTFDIDAIASDPSVMDEARAMAREEGLPAHWLSQNARPWVPPRRADWLPSDHRPGLQIDYAPVRHLLAMKLVSLRRQDRDDIRRLVVSLEMQRAEPYEFAALLAEVYGSDERLAEVMGVDIDAVRNEALALGRWVRTEMSR